MGVVNYLSVDFDVSPRIIWIDTTLSTSISVQNLIDTCSHMSASAANMDDAVLLESSGKEYLTEYRSKSLYSSNIPNRIYISRKGIVFISHFIRVICYSIWLFWWWHYN
jgi:hypothetical protein